MLGTVCCSYGWGGLSPGPLLGTEGSGDVGSPFLCASLRCRCSVQSAYVLKSAYTLWHPDLPIYSLAYRPFVVCMPNWRLLFTWWNYVCMLLWFVCWDDGTTGFLRWVSVWRCANTEKHTIISTPDQPVSCPASISLSSFIWLFFI